MLLSEKSRNCFSLFSLLTITLQNLLLIPEKMFRKKQTVEVDMDIFLSHILFSF